MARSPQTAKIGREMRDALSKTLSEVMLAAANAVEAASPVRTGHLLSNFILSVGSPHTGVEGSPEAVSRSAQEAGKAAVGRFDVGRDARIYLTNHVEYLKYLPGFVTQALMTAVQAAPRGMKGRARSVLKSVARSAFKKGA